MTPEALVTATSGPVNSLGAAFYFDKATLTVGKDNGLDGFRFYVLGRGGVLGDVDSAVITSAFGYFNPGLVAKIWNSGRETLSPAAAAQLYFGCNADLGRAKLGDTAGLEAFCDAAAQVMTDVNPAALALYAGISGQELPEDLPGRALHLIVAHRELRGCLHLAAIVAAGMHPAVAHALRRPNDMETFGWPADLDIPDGSQELLAEIDATTDRLTADAYRTLTYAQRQGFADGVAAMEAAFAS